MQQVRMIKSLGSAAVLGAALVAAVAFASPTQDPGGAAKTEGASQAGGVAVQFEFDKDFGKAEGIKGTQMDADAAAQRYVTKERKWKIGPNGSPKDPDSQFVVFVGKASLPEGSGAADFDARRQIAADNALLDAKKQLSNYLKQTVSAEMRSLYVEGSRGPDGKPVLADPIAQMNEARSPSQAKSPGVIDKVKALINNELDKRLREEGIDPSLQTPEQKEAAKAKAIEAAKKITSSETFSSMVRSISENEVSGLQAFRTFESATPKGGMIAVVAIYSKKSRELQEALLGKREVPLGAPKVSITDWIDSLGEDPADVLLFTHGTQVRTDENGELVVVGFGQSFPVGATDRQLDMAGEKACMEAIGALRRFMGESIVAELQQARAAEMQSYENATSRFESASSFERDVRAVADGLDMSGATPVYQWKKQHPGSDRPTCGCALSYSVSQSELANKFRVDMQKSGGAAGGKGMTDKLPPAPPPPTKPKAPAGTGSGTSGQGAEGEAP